MELVFGSGESGCGGPPQIFPLPEPQCMFCSNLTCKLKVEKLKVKVEMKVEKLKE